MTVQIKVLFWNLESKFNTTFFNYEKALEIIDKIFCKCKFALLLLNVYCVNLLTGLNFHFKDTIKIKCKCKMIVFFKD